jgi:hypothetical protein
MKERLSWPRLRMWSSKSESLKLWKSEIFSGGRERLRMVVNTYMVGMSDS